MITKQDLLEAIAECQGIRNPNANTCLKLAAFYTILDHLEDEQNSDNQESDNKKSRSFSSVSFSAPEQTVSVDGASEFFQAVNGLPSQSAWAVMNELMSTLQMIEPKLYHAVMRKIQEVQ